MLPIYYAKYSKNNSNNSVFKFQIVYNFGTMKNKS